MKPHRRRFLHLVAGTVALPAALRLASAQDYPRRPVRIIVGFASGSALDILARLIGQWLSERLGQPFVIEDRPGAGGSLAAEAVVRARPDGYTLLVGGSPDAINATLYENLNYKFLRDIAPVAGISRAPNVMVAHPSFPAKTVPEFIAYAKANPRKISFASAGIGSVSHVSAELFSVMAGVRMVHVPYRGLPQALTDLIGGRVQVTFSTMATAIGYIRSGTLHAFAVTSAARSDALPDLPTVGDFLPTYEADLISGLGAPRNTPAEIVERLNAEINASLANPEIKARLAELGNVPIPMAAAEFAALMAEEIKKWGRVVKFSGAKAE
jgi:tripartite-type tricarboxylate transporter receptor subunit TctC